MMAMTTKISISVKPRAQVPLMASSFRARADQQAGNQDENEGDSNELYQLSKEFILEFQKKLLGLLIQGFDSRRASNKRQGLPQ